MPTTPDDAQPLHKAKSQRFRIGGLEPRLARSAGSRRLLSNPLGGMNGSPTEHQEMGGEGYVGNRVSQRLAALQSN